MGASNHALIIDRRNACIVVDTCIGKDTVRSIPAWDHLQTGFLDDLAAAGYPTDAVDVVLCTHLHVDHVGWNTRLENDRWVPTFSNAWQLMGADEGHDDRQTLLELTEMLAKEIRAGWDLKLDNPFDWTYTRFGLTNEYRDEVRHVVADESGSCVVGLNLRACGPLDCHVLGPCLEKLLLLQHLDLSQNPDLTGDLAALNGLVYLSTLNVSDCPRITGSLQDLSGLLSVTALNVANCPGVTGVLSALAELSNLLELDVTGCPEVHGDVSALWRAVPSCVVRHEERHVPHHVDDKDDVLGAVLEEDLEELDALEHFGTGGDDAAALIFTEERDNRLAETLRATQPRMMVVTAAADTNAAEPAAELSREASPVGWGRG